MSREEVPPDTRVLDGPRLLNPPPADGARTRRWKVARPLVVRLAAGIGIAVLALLVVLWLGEAGVYNLPFALSILPSLLKGFTLTAEIIIVIVPLGFGLGLLVGWARTSPAAWVRGFAGVYVDFFRSMPPIVLIAFAYLIGLIGLQNEIADPFLQHTIALWFGVVALGLHTSAYQAEIVRAGILSVPAGQTEAALAVGMSRLRSLFMVVLPQAFRVSLPALGNEFSSVIKDSSLLSVIGWLELSGIGLVQLYGALRIGLSGPLIVWIAIAIFYFLVTFALNSTVRTVENAFKVPGLEAGQL